MVNEKNSKVKSKKEVIDRLVSTVGEIVEEQVRLAKKLDNVTKILKLLVEDPGYQFGGDDDVNLDDAVEVEKEDAEECEVDGVIYKLGQIVELKDYRTGRWTITGKLVKFNNAMATIKIGPNKKTRRKYGNFRLSSN